MDKMDNATLERLQRLERKKIPQRHVFVTVGSTKFDALVEEMCRFDTIKLLSDHGYTDVILQIGTGKIPNDVSKYRPWPSMDMTLSLEENLKNGDCTFIVDVESNKTIYIDMFRFSPSIEGLLSVSSLVISHAGAGTTLETLSQGKSLITVINDSLMDQHQRELAEKLSDLGCSVACRPFELKSVITEFKANEMRPFAKGDPSKLIAYLNKVFVTT